jgi:hypothetical protein
MGEKETNTARCNKASLVQPSHRHKRCACRSVRRGSGGGGGGGLVFALVRAVTLVVAVLVQLITVLPIPPPVLQHPLRHRELSAQLLDGLLLLRELCVARRLIHAITLLLSRRRRRLSLLFLPLLLLLRLQSALVELRCRLRGKQSVCGRAGRRRAGDGGGRRRRAVGERDGGEWRGRV